MGGEHRRRFIPPPEDVTERTVHDLNVVNPYRGQRFGIMARLKILRALERLDEYCPEELKADLMSKTHRQIGGVVFSFPLAMLSMGSFSVAYFLRHWRASC